MEEIPCGKVVDMETMLSRAEESLRKAFEQSPYERGIFHFRWTDLNYSYNAFFMACDVYKKDPDNARANYIMGMIYPFVTQATTPTERQEKGLFHLNRAVHLAPGNPDFLADYAAALWYSGNLSEALSHIQRSLEINPENGQYDYTLGWMREAQGHREEAKQLYTTAKMKLEALAQPRAEDKRFLSNAVVALMMMEPRPPSREHCLGDGLLI